MIDPQYFTEAIQSLMLLFGVLVALIVSVPIGHIIQAIKNKRGKRNE